MKALQYSFLKKLMMLGILLGISCKSSGDVLSSIGSIATSAATGAAAGAMVAAGIPIIDPTSIDAERQMPQIPDGSALPPGVNPFMPMDNSASGSAIMQNKLAPDLTTLFNCKRNAAFRNTKKCADAIQHFCSGYCSRLNCAILENRSTCLDVCGESSAMMEPCIAAGKRDPDAVRAIPPLDKDALKTTDEQKMMMGMGGSRLGYGNMGTANVGSSDKSPSVGNK